MKLMRRGDSGRRIIGQGKGSGGSGGNRQGEGKRKG